MPDEILQKIRRSPLAKGEFATITVWVSEEGQNRCYCLHPDLSVSHHAPIVYFNEQGEQVLVVPEFPVEAGKSYPILDTDTILERQADLLKGLKQGPTFNIRSPTHRCSSK